MRESISFIAVLITVLIMGLCNKPIENRAKVQTELHAACIYLLHVVYKEHPDIWVELQQTKEYQIVDSLKQGDWEDFYLY